MRKQRKREMRRSVRKRNRVGTVAGLVVVVKKKRKKKDRRKKKKGKKKRN